jgi:DNA-directed RNA polymerase subunit M/transcription elongation factor TFIIS
MDKKWFCEKCGRILTVKQEEKGDSKGVCTCGFIKTVPPIEFVSRGERKKKIEVTEETKTAGFSHICKKCGFEGCEIGEIGAPYSDEANIFLYICKKCGHVERDSYGTSNH